MATPTAALLPGPDELGPAIGDEAVAQFRSAGWCAVAGLLDAALIGESALEAAELLQGDDAQSACGFPYEMPGRVERESTNALNALSLSPRLLRAAGQLLGLRHPTDVRLAESVARDGQGSGALGGEAGHVHSTLMDYHLAVPDPRAGFDAVVAHVALGGSDGSPTAFLEADGKTEREVSYPAGTVLFLRLDTPVRQGVGGLTQQITLRNARSEWVSADDFVRSAPIKLATTPLQLCALGFPPPGHPHWTGATLEQAATRYPDLDLSAFAATASSGDRETELPPAVIPPPPPADESGIQWQDPERAAGTNGAVLSEAQVQEFRENGCLLIDGIWPEDVVMAAADVSEAIYPSTDRSGVPSQGTTARRLRLDDGSDGTHFSQLQPKHNAADSFPFMAPALNDVTLHPRILGAVSECLRVPADGLRLTQAQLTAKFGPEQPPTGDFSWGSEEGNQPMHLDFGNNSLLSPPRATHLPGCPQRLAQSI